MSAIVMETKQIVKFWN